MFVNALYVQAIVGTPVALMSYALQLQWTEPLLQTFGNERERATPLSAEEAVKAQRPDTSEEKTSLSKTSEFFTQSSAEREPASTASFNVRPTLPKLACWMCNVCLSPVTVVVMTMFRSPQIMELRKPFFCRT